MASDRRTAEGVEKASPAVLEELERLRKRVRELEDALASGIPDMAPPDTEPVGAAGAELTLREERQRILAENTEIGLWQVDGKGCTLYMNPAMRAMLELDPGEDIAGRTIHEFFTQESLDRVEQEHVRRRMGIASSYEAELIGGKGTHLHVIISGAGLSGASGELGNTLGMITDITQLKTIEAALRSGEEFLRVVMESAIDSILVFSEKENRILYGNAATEEIFGYPAEELYGNKISVLFSAASVRALRMEMKRLLEMDHGERFGEILEVAGLHRSGSEIPLEISMTATVLDDAPTFIATIRDITERKQQEHALLEEKEKYRSFFVDDLTGDYVSTPDGHVLECNPAFARIFGFDSVQEVLETDPISLYVTPETRDAFLERLKRERVLNNVEMEMKRKDGTPVFIVENVTGEFNARGELVRFKGYVFDITGRKMLEDQLRQSQKMEAVGRLAGGVAHDFNNVLTAIMGYTDLLGHAMEPGTRMHRQLEEIRKAGDRASSLTRQLLAFSRRQVLNPIVLDLNEVIRDMEEMMKRLIPEYIRLELHLDPVHPVRADLVQIQQVVLNLAVNARDAMPTGGRLRIETSNTVIESDERIRPLDLVPGEYAMLSVSDTGIGMDEETLNRAFEPFFTTKEQGKGTGLGLSTVYGIIKQSGGDLRVRSTPGQGSTFEMFLPKMSEAASGTDVSGMTASAGTGYETVLLVEDEEPVRQMVREILEINGHVVLEATGSEEALEIGLNHDGTIHLLLTDVVMPDLGGLEVAEQLRRSRKNLRVLFMSGYAGDEMAGLDVGEGGHSFIRKPFRATELMKRVRQVLDIDPEPDRG